MPILTGVFNYPAVGLDQIENDLEAEALWTIIELNNATAQMLASGSTEGLPIYNNLKERGLIAADMAADLEAGIRSSAGTTVVGPESGITEVKRTVEEDQLVLTVCFQTSYSIRDADGTEVDSGQGTSTRKYTFGVSDSKFQVVGLQQSPVNADVIVPCGL